MKFTWSEVYENSKALLVHFGASYAGEYVAKSNELAASFEIEIYGDLSKEAIETVKSFGLPFTHLKFKLIKRLDKKRCRTFYLRVI